jgi:integrase
VKGALAAIQFVHREAGHTLSREARAIAAVLAGITRTSSRPIRHAAALELETLRGLIAGINGGDVRALRDRALLLVGFFGALRRSELVSLDVTVGKLGGRSGLEICAHGLRVHVSASKASAETQTIVIPRRADALCATAAVERYLAAAAITRGPLFRAVSKGGRLLPRRFDAASVRHVLKARSGGSRFSPHSLRAGFITSAAKRSVPEHLIQRVSRHASAEVLRGYIRAGDDFADGAAARL